MTVSGVTGRNKRYKRGFISNCHMRLSVPGIPQAILNAGGHSNAVRDVVRARERLYNFIRHGNVTVLTGAGVSVDSGIRAYRGEDGRYMNPNYKSVVRKTRHRHR